MDVLIHLQGVQINRERVHNYVNLILTHTYHTLKTVQCGPELLKWGKYSYKTLCSAVLDQWCKVYQENSSR